MSNNWFHQGNYVGKFMLHISTHSAIVLELVVCPSHRPGLYKLVLSNGIMLLKWHNKLRSTPLSQWFSVWLLFVSELSLQALVTLHLFYPCPAMVHKYILLYIFQHRTMVKKIVSSLPKRLLTANDKEIVNDDICPICIESYTVEDTIRTLPCE